MNTRLARAEAYYGVSPAVTVTPVKAAPVKTKTVKAVPVKAAAVEPAKPAAKAEPKAVPPKAVIEPKGAARLREPARRGPNTK